jgi:hypothetical protein
MHARSLGPVYDIPHPPMLLTLCSQHCNSDAVSVSFSCSHNLIFSYELSLQFFGGHFATTGFDGRCCCLSLFLLFFFFFLLPMPFLRVTFLRQKRRARIWLQRLRQTQLGYVECERYRSSKVNKKTERDGEKNMQKEGSSKLWHAATV